MNEPPIEVLAAQAVEPDDLHRPPMPCRACGAWAEWPNSAGWCPECHNRWYRHCKEQRKAELARRPRCALCKRAATYEVGAGESAPMCGRHKNMALACAPDAGIFALGSPPPSGPVLVERVRAHEANLKRKAREEALRSIGMKKVRGSLGGTYWE